MSGIFAKFHILLTLSCIMPSITKKRQCRVAVVLMQFLKTCVPRVDVGAEHVLLPIPRRVVLMQFRLRSIGTGFRQCGSVN